MNVNCKYLTPGAPGPRTRTLEFIPRGKGKGRMFDRMEEDVDDDGLVRNTRIFDKKGKKTMEIKVKKAKKVKGIPIPEYIESVDFSPVGEIFSSTTCTNVEVESE